MSGVAGAPAEVRALRGPEVLEGGARPVSHYERVTGIIATIGLLLTMIGFVLWGLMAGKALHVP